MRQPDATLKQLTQKIADFIEPVIPYLVLESKETAEEAAKKVGPDIWETKKELWEKLCSREGYGLKEAARGMVIAPSEPGIKQILIQKILILFEENPDLAKEISSFMEDETIQKRIAENYSANIKQNSSERNKVLEEFNNLLEEFIAKSSTVQDLKQSGIPETEKTAPDRRVANENNEILRKPWQKYAHPQLDQRFTTENSAVSARMAKIAEINVMNPDEARGSQALFAHVSQLKGQIKEEFMEKALEFACNIQYGDLRSETLSLLVPILEGPRKVEFIKKALYSASEIQDEEERALVFSSLARHLRGADKEELIEHIFDFSSKIKYGDAKFQILSSLAPHLYRSENKAVIEKALDLISGIISKYQRVQSYSLLLPYLNGQIKEEIIERALELAFNLKDKDMRPEALSFILPYLEESKKEEILETALNLASGIKSKYQKAEALSSLAPYLNS